MSNIQLNVQAIQNQVNSILDSVNRLPENLTVICVSKMRSVEDALTVYQNGITHFAENRPEGLLEKQARMLEKDIVWHYIGNLQTRKVKQVINQVDYFHALDRLNLAKEIQKRATHEIKCFVEVNVSGEESKAGVNAKELPDFIEQLAVFDKIKVVGLMTMAPLEASEDEIRRYFKELKALQVSIATLNLDYAPCLELSIGMSNDYPIAIEEGATFVRIGSAFFS